MRLEFVLLYCSLCQISRVVRQLAFRTTKIFWNHAWGLRCALVGVKEVTHHPRRRFHLLKVKN